MILASLCNTHRVVPSPLILVEDDLSSFRWVNLPPEVPGSRGICGLAVSGNSLYLALQTDQLAVLDLADLSVRALHPFRKVKQVHSLMAEDGAVLVVGTGSDTVFEMRFGGGMLAGEKPVWRPDPASPEMDHNHLNSIVRWRGTRVVSGLGEREGPLWDSGRNGFIREMPSGLTVVDGLRQPHSLTVFGDTLVFCESSRGVIRDFDNTRTVTLDGFTRGLCAGAGSLYAATSRGRLVSKSTGIINPDATGRCALYRLDGGTFRPEAELDFGTALDEIYDLLHFGDPPSWPGVI